MTLMATNGVNNEIAMDQLDVDVKIAKVLKSPFLKVILRIRSLILILRIRSLVIITSW